MRTRFLSLLAALILSLLVGATSWASAGSQAGPNPTRRATPPTGYAPIPISGTPLLRERGLEALARNPVRALTPRELLQSGRLGLSGGEYVALAAEEETFWAWNFDTETFYEIDATLEHTSDHAYFYVAEGQTVSASALQTLADEFDDQIYNGMHTYFGQESDIDSDARVFFLLLDIIDAGGSFTTLGYFHPIDLIPDNEHSNQREMMYIDTQNPAAEGTIHVLAHEFQHLVHFNYDRNEESWVNEGLADLAVNLLGYGHSMNHVNAFRAHPDTDLTAWDNNDPVKHYGAAYLWMLYLSEQFPTGGDPLSKRLVANTENSIAGVNAVLAGAGHGDTFNTIFPNWAIANTLNNRGIDGRWGYEDLSFNAARHNSTYLKDPITIGDGAAPAPVNVHAADYDSVRFLNPLLLKKTFRATFEGDAGGNYAFFAISDNRVLAADMETDDGKRTGRVSVAPGLFGQVNYVVARADDAVPSGDYKIRVEPIDNIVFVVDDTGSMGDEIDSVKQTIAEKIDAFAAEDKEYLYTLITFKDYVSNRGSTTDPAEIKAWVASLYASGGGDCPEYSYQALQEAAATVKGGHVWLMTDASSHGSALDALATQYQLFDAGLKLHSVILGDCGSYAPGAPQDGSPNGPGEWPGALDTDDYSSEFGEISRATGGHYFRVTSDEIDEAMETVLNEMNSDGYINWVNLDAASVSPTEVLVDAGTSKVGFLLNTYVGTSALAVQRPDGTYVQDGDPGVVHVVTSTSDYILIDAPAAGLWRAHFSGVESGLLSVSAETPVALDYIGRATLAYGQPSPLLAYLAGDVASAGFALVDIAGGDSTPVALYDDGAHDDLEADDGIYGGVFTPDEVAVYNLSVAGQTAGGTAFTRVSSVELRVLTLDIAISETIVARPGETVTHHLTVANRDSAADEFELAIQSSAGWADLSAVPGSVSLGPDESIDVSIPVTVPDNAGLGDSDVLLVTAASVANPLLVGTISTATVADPDDVEDPGEPIVCGQSLSQVIGAPGEIDRYAFEGFSGQHLVFAVRAVEDGSHLDPILTLYAPDGETILARNDDFDGLDPRVHLTLPQEGTYTLEVIDFGEPAGGPEYFYDLFADSPVYVTVKGTLTVNGVKYQQNDIFAYYQCADRWELLFDASDVGLKKNLADFTILPGGDLLLAFAGPERVPGLGKVAAQDVVIFNSYRLGEETAGSFAMFFDGSDVGLTKGGEAIDAVTVDRDGRLVISTTGVVSVPGLPATFQDEDLLAFDGLSYGWNTAGSWSLLFDGSNELAAQVETEGVWLDAGYIFNDAYMTFTPKVTVIDSNGSSLVIDPGDIALCRLLGTGPATNCDWLWLAFDGSAHGLGNRLVDGLALGESPYPGSSSSVAPVSDPGAAGKR